MEIVFSKRPDQIVLMGEVPIGSVFKRDTVYYMRVRREALATSLEAVRLHSGVILTFDANTQVVLVHSELVVYGDQK